MEAKLKAAEEAAEAERKRLEEQAIIDAKLKEQEEAAEKERQRLEE